MNTLAYVLILLGLLIARAAYKGRIRQVGDDLSDAMLAFIRGDTKELAEVLARTGDDNEPTNFDIATANLVEGTTGAIGTTSESVGKGLGQLIGGAALLTAAITRGERAKGYRWAATGPDYYDCSGLIWRAAQDAGYKGSRFSTATIRSRKQFVRVNMPGMQLPGQKPQVNAGPGDIVLWPAGSGGVTGHMGVVTGPNRFYSARSVRSGIGESSISGFRKPAPIYLRFTL